MRHNSFRLKSAASIKVDGAKFKHFHIVGHEFGCQAS
jgi:hypothetical protein